MNPMQNKWRVLGITSLCVVSVLLVDTLRAQSQSTTSAPSSGQLSVSEIATNFTRYQQITRGAIYVNPELAALCRGVSIKDVEEARVKFGPHANTRIIVHMNPLAVAAFCTNATVFPVGSFVVKQKTTDGYLDKNGKPVGSENTGVGGMVKRPAGYDPEHGDWEYFYFEDASKIESGRIASCVQCHQAAKGKDYVFGTWKTFGSEVTDAKTAIQKAVAAWEPVFGTEQIAGEKPYQAQLINGVWIVKGSLSKGTMGGVAMAEISKDDGTILSVSHGQ